MMSDDGGDDDDGSSNDNYSIDSKTSDIKMLVAITL